MSRAVVNPARRSFCAFCTAMSSEPSVVPFGGRLLNMCVCASMRPGSTVAWLKSITCTPAGILTWDSGPTSVIRSPERSTTCFVSIWPVLLSKRRPARMASARGAGGHWKKPPSGPTHGGGPAPRHGAGGGASCAPRVAAPSRIPNTASTE